ncbi:MAG TPA: hypothetical protein GX513_11295 [Firmicutes bacterium]|nr:hypothetical protein [Bacillota bacterium]
MVNTEEGGKAQLLGRLGLIARAIAGVTGHNCCEVVVHDLAKPEASIVEIVRGHVTGRVAGGPILGGPLEDQGLDLLREVAGDSCAVGYRTRTKDGQEPTTT